MRAPSSLFRYRNVALFAAIALFGLGLADGAGMPAKPGKPVPHSVTAARCDGTFSNGTRINLTHPRELQDVPGQTVCDFYTFAWNQFIYLTQMSPDMNSRGASDVAIAPTPAFLHMAPWYNLLRAKVLPAPGPYPGGSTALSTAHVDFGQAGTQDHLIDVAGAAVLYDIRFNKVMYEFIRGGLYAEANFTVRCNPDTNGNCQNQLWLPPSGPGVGSPGALEIKSSWRDFGTAANCPPTFYCNGRFGLVGLHLVQKTQSHGEWIWSSFEHVGNDPDCRLGGDEPIAPKSPLATPWSFFDPAKAPPGVMASRTCGVAGASAQCNLDPNVSGPPPSFKAVNICRTDIVVAGGANAVNCTPYKLGTSQVAQNVTGNIACLNATLRPRMKGVWKNYKLIGSLWTSPGAAVQFSFLITGFQCANSSGTGCVQPVQCTTPPPHGSSPPPCLKPAGNVHMANTTMETWTQAGSTGYDPFGTNTSQAGCFLCHNLPFTGTGPVASANYNAPNQSTDDQSHFAGKLPPAKLQALLDSLVPANSTVPGKK